MLNHFLLQQRARWGRCEKALGAAVMALAIALVSGCAPQQTTLDNAGTAEFVTVGTAATAFEWSPEADCATCHVKQASSTADAQCLASTHEDSACNSCHSDSEGLQNVHEGVASAEVELTRLKKPDIDSSYCLTCHDSYEALAGKTVDSQACTDKNGLVVNPHGLPTNVEHEDIDCASCHIMHDSRAAADQAESLCGSCHHENVYECFTCHA